MSAKRENGAEGKFHGEFQSAWPWVLCKRGDALHIGGKVLSIGQLGPGFIIPRDAINHPPGEAEIEMWIDDDERRWKVLLPDGISAEKTRTRIA